MNRASGSRGETPTQDSVRKRGTASPSNQQTAGSSLPSIPRSFTMSTKLTASAKSAAIPAARGTPMCSTVSTEKIKARIRVAPRKDTPGRSSNVLKYLKNELVPKLAQELPKGLTVGEGDEALTIEAVQLRLDKTYYNNGDECRADLLRLCAECKEEKNRRRVLDIVNKSRLPKPEVFITEEEVDNDFLEIVFENTKESEMTVGEQEEAIPMVTPKKNETLAPSVPKILGKRNRPPSFSDNMSPFKSWRSSASLIPWIHRVRRDLNKDMELEESDSNVGNVTWNFKEGWKNCCKKILHELATRKPNSRQMFWKKSQYIWGFVDMSQDAVANLTDLTEIEEKLHSGHYKTRDEFFSDVDKVFSDCVDLNSEVKVKGKSAYFISLAKSAQNYVWARERDFFPNLKLIKAEKEDPKPVFQQSSDESSNEES